MSTFKNFTYTDDPFDTAFSPAKDPLIQDLIARIAELEQQVAELQYLRKEDELIRRVNAELEDMKNDQYEAQWAFAGEGASDDFYNVGPSNLVNFSGGTAADPSTIVHEAEDELDEDVANIIDLIRLMVLYGKE